MTMLHRTVMSIALVLFASPLQAQLPSGSRETVDPALFQNLEYRMIGPSRGGRVTTVTGIAEQPSVFFMGSTGGGVWKTTDYGNSWENVSDGYFSTGSMGAIQIADSNPDVIYAGTGSDGIRSNVITGRGVYKSIDGAESWQFIGLREAGQIGAIEVHPTNPDLVYVAAMGHAFGPNPERGVYRSSDGGATWENILFVSDTTGAVDLEFKPGNPSVIYAAMYRGERKPWTIISGSHEGGIFKSTDGGDNWTKLSAGLPQGLVGKIDLAVSPDAPERVYALVEAPDAEEGLYRSDDAGATWRLMSQHDGLMDRPFYFTNVTADPNDADVLYVGAVGWFKSTDGGATFERRGTPHSDNHDLWINPNDSNLFIQANDGGVNVTRNGGETWSTQFNQPTAELYQVAVDNRFPYWVYAGQQDNSTIGVPSLPPTSSPPSVPMANWIEIGGCETGPAVPKLDDWKIVYANCKGRFGRYSHETGQEKQYWVGGQYMYGHNPADLIYRFQRVSPIEISPHDAGVVYHASQFLHMTRNGGETWETISPDLTANRSEYQVISGAPITRDVTGEEFFSTIYAVEVSPLVEGMIWVGANDGPVHVTRDGGQTWTDVTPEDLPPNARIQNVEPSPHDPAEAYIAAYRYLLDDWRPYIYRTTDYGESWTLLTTGDNGIPADFPTRVVREDPNREGLLYAGTEFGMFISFDEGEHWQSFKQNMPTTPITDIEVHKGDLVLSTMGRSFWIMDNLSTLHQLDREVAAAPAHLFEPADAYRMRYRGSDGENGNPEYPDVGARIDYHFANAPAGEVRLEILTRSGEVIREYSSASNDDLETTAGTHSFVWDLSYPGPWSADERRRGRGGPLAVPGQYQVRMSAGDWTATRDFRVLVDPRVAADGVTQADLEAQLALNLQIRDAISDARQAAARIDAAQEAGNEFDRLADLERQLITLSTGSYQQPMLLDQIGYLQGLTTGADQRPGDDAYTRYAQLRAELDSFLAELDEVLQ
ncbi:MAG TPA: hypothetical protein VFI91_05665 [Longimicrobiaceae bacterium]|nr:hypothetical protein [Longimicrobiaceae bacterium]